MREALIDISKFSGGVFEIPLNASANGEFDCTIQGITFTFKTQTFYNNETRISIFADGACVCQNAPISIYFTNLLLYSSIESLAIFFANFSSKGITADNASYEALGDTIRLFYGVY